MLRSFYLNFLQNKMWPIDHNGHAFRDALHSSNNLFRPFSASLVLLELFSDCLQNVTFLSSKSNSSNGNRKVGPDIFKLLEAAVIVCNLHTKLMLLCVALHIFCAGNLGIHSPHSQKNPFLASLIPKRVLCC